MAMLRWFCQISENDRGSDSLWFGLFGVRPELWSTILNIWLIQHRTDKRKHFLPITGKINMQFWLLFFKKQWCLPRTWQKHCCVVTKVLFWVVARWILLGSVVFRSLDVAQFFSVWNQGYFSPMFQSGRRKKFKLLGKVIAQISLQMHDWKCDSSSLSQFYRGDWGNKWSSIMQM